MNYIKTSEDAKGLNVNFKGEGIATKALRHKEMDKTDAPISS